MYARSYKEKGEERDKVGRGRRKRILTRVVKWSVRCLAEGGGGLAARFIDAGAADVSHPFDDIVVTVVELGLEHLQVAHLQTRRSKRNLRRRGKG